MNCRSSSDGQIFLDKKDRLGPAYQLIEMFYSNHKHTILLRPFSIYDAGGEMGYFEDMTNQKVTRRTWRKWKLLCSQSLIEDDEGNG